MSENQCTIAYSPFGYDLAARRAGADVKGLDLAQWRIAGIGGDMVRPEILEAFAEALAPAGFDRRAFLPSYGMAETTLAITFGDLDRAPRIDVVDRALQAAPHRRPGVAGLARDAGPDPRLRRLRPPASRP